MVQKILNRANHTGTQAASTIVEDSTHRFATDAEKTAWNAKQTALTLTTSGTSGAATLSGGTLNIPQYTGGGGSSTYTVTTLTKAAIQTAIDAASSNSYITLAPGNYTGFDGSNTLNIGGKTGLVINGFGTANLSTAAASNIILFNGNNVRTRITGINFSCTAASGGGSGLILINEQGTNDGLEIDHCTFTSPTCRMNGITASVYSVQANGGSGSGKLTQDVHIHDNRFVSLGRMGIELVNHTWDDAKTNIYLKNIQVHNNYFNDLGKVAETDGTTFNGMAFSNSGYANDIAVINNQIIDAKLLGIELAGSEKAIIANNTIDSINNTFTGISVSDNSHNATKYITIIGNNVRTKAKCLAMNQVQQFTVSGNTFIQTAASGNGGTLYFQNCLKGTLTGGTVLGFSYNTIRLDDTNKMFIGGGIRIESLDTGNFSLVSIYGGTSPAGSSYITVGTECMFEKLGGPALTGVVETIGNTTNITGVR